MALRETDEMNHICRYIDIDLGHITVYHGISHMYFARIEKKTNIQKQQLFSSRFRRIRSIFASTHTHALRAK